MVLSPTLRLLTLLLRGYLDVGITTLSHVGTQYVNENRIFTGIITNVSFSNHLVGPLGQIDVGIVTNLSGTNATYENITGTAVTATDLHFKDDLFGPDAYIQSGIITAFRAEYIGGIGNAGANQPTLQINVNSGIITSLVGTAATMQEIYMNPNGRITTPFIYGNTGIITNFGDGSKVINIKKCGQGKGIAYQWESTATNVPPFVVQSTSKVNNLNADLLDGLNTSWDDQSGNSIVRRLNGDSKFDVSHFNNINSANGTFTGAISCDNVNCC